MDKMKAIARHLALPLVLGALMAVAVGNVAAGQERDGARTLEDAVRRAAVAYYASEGVYPPSLESMEEKYALQIDERKYVVKYDAFSENLMPDVTVIQLEVKK